MLAIFRKRERHGFSFTIRADLALELAVWATDGGFFNY
jgi:hypothetical protein